MRDDFRKAIRILGTSGNRQNTVAVNGCCYGQDANPAKGDYLKYCGQQFWEFISGDAELYTALIEPLGYQARQRNDEFLQAYAQLINTFTLEFASEFYTVANEIDWVRLVEFNSRGAR